MRLIIAEVGQNHNGDMSLAKELILAAKESGADVAKFQLFDVDKTFSELYKKSPEIKKLWYKYHCKTQLSKDQAYALAEECYKAGIEFMASSFDKIRVAWLQEIGVKRHKVASRSVNDNSLLEALKKTEKPLIISLGMWSKEGFPKVKTKATVDFLYCISKYPTELTDLHLNKVDFNKYGGFSDHTIGISAAICALSRGAMILEKHFTLDKNADGPDHAISMTPNELQQIHQFRNELDQML